MVFEIPFPAFCREYVLRCIPFVGHVEEYPFCFIVTLFHTLIGEFFKAALHFNKEGDVVQQSVHVRGYPGSGIPRPYPLYEQDSSTYALACAEMTFAAVLDKLKSES